MAVAVTAIEGFKAGMDRETLTRSLKALAVEMESLRREEFSAGLAVLGADGRLDQEQEHGETADPELVEYHRRDLARSTGRKEAVASIRGRLETIGRALETDAAALTAERATYTRIFATMATVQPSAVPVEPVPVINSVPVAASAPMSSPVAPPAPIDDEYRDKRAITSDMFLSEAGKIVLDLREKAKEGSEKKDDRYQERLENALAAFIDVIGDKPLKYYLALHMQDFANAMAKCPTNRTQYPHFNGLSIWEMIEVNARNKKPIPTLSTSSVSSLVSEVGNLWTKITAGVSDVKDIKNYRITMPSAASKSIAREGLPISSLNIWMKAAAALYPRNAYKKFMPLVALLSGMRQGELVWLQPRDIVEIDGHTVVDLRQPLIIGGKEVVRSLKTDTSPRIVALHPFLREAGFIDFAKDRRHWIFGEFHRAEKPSDAAQKQMGNWMTALGIHEKQRHVFHSLRHNAKHWIRNGITMGDAKLIADRQCGHSAKSVGDRYGFISLQSDEIEKIEALPLPKRIDFSGFLEPSKMKRGR